MRAYPRTPERVAGRLFGLSPREWESILALAAIATMMLAPWYVPRAWLIGPAIFFAVVVFGHLCSTADRYVALLGLVSLSACLQWIVGPLLAEFFPPSFPQYRMVVPLERYLAYALPATVALWVGIHWPSRSLLRVHLPSFHSGHLNRPVCRALDAIIFGGFLLDAAWGYVPGGLSFLVHILATFRFFAALVWMVTRTPGWKLRVGVVFVHLALRAAEQTLFYHLVHWAGYFLLIQGFSRRWRWRLGLALILAVFVAARLQQVKGDFRLAVQAGEAPGVLERVVMLGTLMAGNVEGASQAGPRRELGDVVVRFNQGWIIARIMQRVPAQVPYAEGETLSDAVLFSLMPRLVFHGKRPGASKTKFAKYTGIQLGPDTSMGLGIIGEMYANFGPLGGIAATFMYASLIGLLFWKLALLAAKNPVWWAVIPIILLPIAEPSWNIDDVCNYVSKSGLVVVLFLWLLPSWSGFLGLRYSGRKAVPAASSPGRAALIP